MARVPLDKVLGLAQALFQQAYDVHRQAAEKRGEKLATPPQHGALLLDKDFLDAWARDIERAKQAEEKAKKEKKRGTITKRGKSSWQYRAFDDYMN